MRDPTKLEASEENAGQKNQKTDKQGFEAMGANDRNRDVRVADKKSADGEQHGKEEGQLRGRC
jgi:hypothetical protein